MAVTRWLWMALVMGGTVTATGSVRQDPGPDWLQVDGDDWREMEPDARLAYVRGFLAGAALGQAAAGAHDSAKVAMKLETLRRNGELLFPFGSNVYASRLSDYYWWKNHLPLPTWYAFLEVNTTFGR